VDLVPLSEDVTKLHTFLHKELERNVTILQNADSTDAVKKQSWRELSVTVLAQLITFNKESNAKRQLLLYMWNLTTKMWEKRLL